MKLRSSSLCVPAMVVFLALMSLPSVASAAQSPTGRSPRLMWTPARQDVWNRMRTDYLANPGSPRTLGGTWFKVVKDNAECSCRYADHGLWATLMYQWTGDTRYVELAWTAISRYMAWPLTQRVGNAAREYSIEQVILLDWLWPGLTPQRQSQFSASILEVLNQHLNGYPSVPGYGMNDSDAVIGIYFAVAAFHTAFPANTLAASLFNHRLTGGLTATGVDMATARNSVNLYVTSLAEGGEFIESAAYNLGTVRLLLMGAEAIRTATGVDHFPEVTRWTPRWAARQMAFWTGDLEATYQWGDEEHPRERTLFEWTNTSGLTAGLLQGTVEGAQLQQQLLDLVGKYGPVGYNTMEPVVTGRLFFTFNPYAPVADWRVNKSFYAAGMGLLLQRGGVAGDSLFAAHFAPRPGGKSVHHAVHYLNDFELWRNGEWVLTHPRGYSGAPNYGLGTNSVLMHGFGDMWGFKEVTARATGDTYAFLQGTTGATAVPTGYYRPPPVFVHEWTRSVLYLNGATDTVVVFDRAHMETQVEGLDRYGPVDLRKITTSATAPKQWLLHMPVIPNVGANFVSWATPGGQSVRWTPLLPAGSTKVVQDETVLAKTDTAWSSAVKPSELKYHVRLSPNVIRPWDTFLNVIQVGTPGTVTLRSLPGQVEGAHITRPGQADVLALFNAAPGPKLAPASFDPSHAAALRVAHLRSTGFTINWTGQASATEIFLADLDPRKRWAAVADGVSVAAFDVSSDGVARFTISGSGTHSLSLSVVGEASVQPAAPTGLRIVQ
jgi:hypothetical protein